MSVNGGPNIFDTSLLIFLDAADRDSYTPGSTTWYDLSGNNNHFTLYNGVGFSSNNKGYLTFDGTNDYIRSQNQIDLTVFDGVVVEMTLQKNNNVVAMIWEFSNNWNSNTGGFGCASDDNGGGTTPGEHHTNWNGGNGARDYLYSHNLNWYTDTNILMKINDPTGRLSYVNADLKPFVRYATTTNTLSSYVFRTDYFYLGSRNGSTLYLNGNISSFKVYTIKLSGSNILQNYNNTKSRFGL